MYSVRPGLVLGFHGTDESVANKVVSGKESILHSKKTHEWLGHGQYFWENDPQRAYEYAIDKMQRKPLPGEIEIKKPAVIGAVIDLKYCFDLLDRENIKALKSGFIYLRKGLVKSSLPLPKNKKVKKSIDLINRELDCAVIEELHRIRSLANLAPFDSIRSAFWEGAKVYSTAGFRDKNHIQICVRNPNCIKGYFLPREEVSFP